jgi:integrase
MGRHQTGHIYEASSAFYVRFYNGAKQASHRLCEKNDKYYSRTCKAVKLLRDQFMTTVNTQPAHVCADMRIADFWEQRYLPYCEAIRPVDGHPRKKFSTLYGYRQIWRQHLKPHFAEMTLQEYTPAMAKRLLHGLKDSQGKATLKHVRSLAAAIFKHAVNEEILTVNPWREIPIPDDAVESAATEHYTIEEAEDMISALVDRVDCQLILALSCFLGLRPGEIAALKWEDFDREEVHIRRSVVRGKVGTPKTLEALADLPLIDRVRIPLELWRRRSGLTEGWVFPSANNTPIDLHNIIARVIRPAIEVKGLRWKGLYAGRRGAGTAIIEITNGNGAVGQALLRHKNMSTTLAFYKKQISAGALRAGMKLLDTPRD